MSEGDFTEISSQSWLSRMKNAIVGVLIGIILVPGSIWLLSWNEGRSVQTYRSLSEGSGVVKPVQPGSIDPAMEGKQYPVTPRQTGTVGATGRYEGATLTLVGRHAGRRYLVSDVNNAFPKLTPYWVWDVKASYRIGPFTFFASVYNVADREYMDSGGVRNVFGGPPAFAITQELRFNPAPERSWLLGGEVDF